MSYNTYMLGINLQSTERKDKTFRAMQERKLQKKSRSIFMKQLKWAVKEAKKFDYAKNTTEKEIDDSINEMPFKAALSYTIVASMRKTMNKAIRTSFKDFRLKRFGVTYKAVNKEAERFLNGKLSHELSNYKGTISKNTIVKISKIIKTSIKEGLSYNETAKLIMKQGKAGVFSMARAKLIAIRETGQAYERGNLYSMQEFKKQNPDRKVKKNWITFRDHKVTDPCKANQRQGWIDLKLKFSSGDDSATRDDHPRCRCSTSYDILAPGK